MYPPLLSRSTRGYWPQLSARQRAQSAACPAVACAACPPAAFARFPVAVCVRCSCRVCRWAEYAACPGAVCGRCRRARCGRSTSHCHSWRSTSASPTSRTHGPSCWSAARTPAGRCSPSRCATSSTTSTSSRPSRSAPPPRRCCSTSRCSTSIRRAASFRASRWYRSSSVITRLPSSPRRPAPTPSPGAPPCPPRLQPGCAMRSAPRPALSSRSIWVVPTCPRSTSTSSTPAGSPLQSRAGPWRRSCRPTDRSRPVRAWAPTS